MSYEISRAREFVADIDEISSQPFAGFERGFNNDRLGPVRFWPVKGFDRYLIAYQPNRASRTLRAIRLLNSYRDVTAIFADE